MGDGYGDAFTRFWLEFMKQLHPQQIEPDIKNVAPPKPIPQQARIWSQSKITGIEVAGDWCDADEAIATKDRYRVQFTDYDWWIEYKEVRQRRLSDEE